MTAESATGLEPQVDDVPMTAFDDAAAFQAAAVPDAATLREAGVTAIPLTVPGPEAELIRVSHEVDRIRRERIDPLVRPATGSQPE